MAEEWKERRYEQDIYNRRTSHAVSMSFREMEMVERIMKAHNLQTFSSTVRWLIYQETERMENETGRH